MSGRLLRLACTAAAATTAAGTLLAPTHATAAPEPQERSVAKLLTDLQRLYLEAEQATETYNATEEDLKRQRTEVTRLDTALSRTRVALHESRSAAGRLARQQYQNTTDISPYVHLLLARDPQHALDQSHVIGKLARERAETVGRLTGTERKADELARKARKALDDQLALAERRKKNKDAVHKRLEKIEALLAALTADQLKALAGLEKKDTTRAQKSFLASGALAEDDHKPSRESARAVRYAKKQLGKPYKWGAEGPKSYDCSGLTSEAWAHAGTRIPRTSQEQWAQLDRIPLTELRPGDLVVYFPEATHVAMYLGKGKVVQAPRTGEKIKISPIASNPVLGAVRPEVHRDEHPKSGAEVRSPKPQRGKPRSSPAHRSSSRSRPGH